MNDTDEIQALVNAAMSRLDSVSDAHVIDQVWCAIERSPELRSIYDGLLKSLGRQVVNPGIGKRVRETTGLISLREHRLQSKGSLVGTYTLLVVDHLSLPEEVTGPAPEGGKSTIEVNRYERDPDLRRQCIEHYGPRCVICEFAFKEKYGEEFAGFIHVHHLQPLSELHEETMVDPIKDLRPVCPNCHAIIHKRRNPPYGIEEVREMLNQAGKERGKNA